MIEEKIYQLLEAAAGTDHIYREEPMKNHTTFRIGGNAEVFAAPDSADGVERVLQICREENIPCTVIGNGNNLLVGTAACAAWCCRFTEIMPVSG